MQDFLKLPLSFQAFFDHQKMPTCTLKESIARNLHLLITTGTGENKQDLEYGAHFWDTDYDIHISNDVRREMIINSLRRQIEQYEPRLTDIVIEVNVRQSDFNGLAAKQLRRRIEMIITANLSHSKEPFRFQTGFFIGPLAFD
jgi:predicted component of type VI protein secretion system